ncbi:hypothetical protein DPMN_001085 [Dreissena polymorpha]|uniref:Uncharacterized protein n=1 Tax=Dreissena polymorpha TaxID=45954 RepID=A0A9D4MIP9_DREPO|nr:hypothetical protein DPMN_001085 [Dreissena polymorpha]
MSRHVFQPTGTIFELVQDILGTNLLTKFHENRTINVASRVLTRKQMPRPPPPPPPPPPGGHVFKTNQNQFLTCSRFHWQKCSDQFHEGQAINGAFRVLTRQMLTPNNASRMPDKR